MTAVEPDQGISTLILQRLDDLREDVRELRNGFVPNAVWSQRNEHVDATFRTLGREIGDLRAEVRSKSIPWPMVVSAVCAMAAVVLALIN